MPKTECKSKTNPTKLLFVSALVNLNKFVTEKQFYGKKSIKKFLP